MKLLPYFTVLSVSLFLGGLASFGRSIEPSSSALRAEVSSSGPIPQGQMDGHADRRADPSDERSGVMPAYCRGKLMSLTYTMKSTRRADRLFANGRPRRRIFVCDSGLPGNRPFLSVIDVAPGFLDAPWLETKVRFRPGYKPRQMRSAYEIEAAAHEGEVSLDYTKDVYRCEEAETH